MRQMRGQNEFWHGLLPPAPESSRKPGFLSELVDSQILPRLLRAHPRQAIPCREIDAFARLLIAPDPTPAFAALAACSDALAFELLEGAARRLGGFWREDACDFFHVTQGCARLRAMLSMRQTHRTDDPGSRGALLLLTTPGETHRFGADMAAEAFRREGWTVLRADGRLGALARRRFDAVGVSCAGERAAAGLPAFLAGARARARGRPAFLVGGAWFIDRPEKARNLPVDFVADEPGAARRISRALLGGRAAAAM